VKRTGEEAPKGRTLTRFGHAASPCSITSSAWARIDWGTHEAERLGGLEIDRQLDFNRLLNRQVGIRLRDCRMSGSSDLDGTWGFVFAGVLGIGIGGMVVKDGKFHGADSGGVKYRGTIERVPGTDRVKLDFDMDVPPDIMLVGGGSAQELPMKRHQSFELPANFVDGIPVDLPLHGAKATGMFRPIDDAWAPLADGFTIQRK
jgi:hypothetical protein